MNSPPRANRASLLPILLIGLLAGTACISSSSLSNRAIDYNVAAETTRNQMLLLNILRARDRKPMTFTGLASITGSVRATRGINTTGRVGIPGADSITGAPSLGLTDSPTFNVAVLDSQEFTRGIMAPLAFDLVEYFWDQGFTREVLLYLVAERIEVDCSNRSGETSLIELVNDPAEPSWEAFQQVVHDLADDGEWLANQYRTVIGPPVAASEVTRLPTLIQVAGSQLEVQPLEDGTWQLERPVSTLRLSTVTDAPCGAEDRGPVRLDLYESKAAFGLASAPGERDRRGRIVLRSPQSILFFLGELARPTNVIHIRSRRPDQPMPERRLFQVADALECPAGPISVDYEGQTYVIPGGDGPCHGGRSLQSLALAAQLLALQQSSRDLPVTSTVRIIGQ